MTGIEIKTELAKVAIMSGTNIETCKVFYDWITEPQNVELREVIKTKYDDVPIEELAAKTRMYGTIVKRCHENGIMTVGDIIRYGARKFLMCRLVGKVALTKIDDALEEHYGVKDWYKT